MILKYRRLNIEGIRTILGFRTGAMDILIFEDDAYSAELMAQIVQEMGYSSEKFLQGSGALEAVMSHRPRAVILDVMLPGMDGLTICRSLKSDPQTAGIKVIIATAKGLAGDKEGALRSGADDFIS